MTDQTSWVSYIAQAYEIAQVSPDPSTQNAALLVDEVDYEPVMGDINRFPDGVTYLPERWVRPLKYKIIEHAERNVIYKAARLGLRTKGLKMVSPWAACSDCARAIIQSGITTLVRHKQAGDRSPEFWREEIDIADTLLHEGGVEIIDVDISGLHVPPILHSGELWHP